MESLRFSLNKDELTPRSTDFPTPLILSVSSPHKRICSLFTLTKNIVKWQFEKILSQASSSACIIDKNKCVTRMWCIIHVVQTAETCLGFSRRVEERNPRRSVWLSTWCSFRQKHFGWCYYLLVFWMVQLLLGDLWVHGSFCTTWDWHCLLNKFSFK